MPAVLVMQTDPHPKSAVLLLMEAFGVTLHIRDVAVRMRNGLLLGRWFDFFTACQLSHEIAAAALFYGMVPDEWIDAVKEIKVPGYLFFGGQDRFISGDRIQQIQSRFEELKITA